jgi:inorganic pyrophosphatase
MPDYTRLPIGEKAPPRINAVIEIPKDSVKQLHVFKLDRTLFSPVHDPGDYGFIPCTLGQDGDPLDVLVLVEAPSFPGCLIEVRPIGVLQMVDQGKKDEKILAVAESDPLYKDVHDLFAGVLTHSKRNRALLFHLQSWKERRPRWPAGR